MAFSFGSTSKSNPTGGLFGNGASTQNDLFGNGASTQSSFCFSFGVPKQPYDFGSQPQQTTSGGLFGGAHSISKSLGSKELVKSASSSTSSSSTDSEEVEVTATGFKRSDGMLGADSVKASETTKSEPGHADLVLSSLRDLREQDIVQDFTIDVGDESFKVHRAVLAACSQYFRAMFSHDTKERQESTVKMEDVDASAVKECIDFMYSGDANVTVDTASDILHAASIMQLERLTKSCFKKIEEILEAENCLDIAGMLEIYPCEQLQSKVENCIRENFKDVTNTKKFKIKPVEELKSFVSEFSENDEEVWGAIKSWLGHDEGERNQYLDELLPLVKLDEFPSAVLLQSIINDSLIKEFPEGFDIFIKRLFSSTEELTDNLTVKNCSIVKRFANKHDHITKEALNIINKFLIDNFEQVLIKSNFVDLAGKDVLMILRASNVEYLASEELRWNAVMKWVKHDSKRTQLLPELLKTVDFSQFTIDFIQDTVRQEPLMKVSSEYINVLMDSVHKRSCKRRKISECIAVLSKTGEISAFHLDAEKSSLCIPSIPEPKSAKSRIFSFNGKLCFFDGRSIFFLGKNKKWIKRMEKNIGRNSKIAVVENSIYFVSSPRTCVFDTLSGSWKNDLQGCKFDGDVAVLDNEIYAFGSDGVKVFKNKNAWHWILQDTTPAGTTAAAFMSNIYCLAPRSTNLRLFKIHPTFSFGGSAIWDEVTTIPGSTPESTCIFGADNKLLVLSVTSSAETLYAYDKICNAWMTMKTTQRHAETSSLKALSQYSGCSFSENI